ncbi:MAG TPA: PBP1A family penicillin-binding protein [Henriciella marina]|uniref:transglycosylase domain-containing protein n=1 Tax=Henriciella sp. TaxID=1968823 RepID=UPI0018479AF0|nr:PBP1A family penicillin-binding protein [Henriciella sp.]HIG23534.1 PBP1A family penicillin-binding protein [Henriciella sp.]HIK65328.1 PBP1A family penicillin-binding protein [Henriciella marina]
MAGKSNFGSPGDRPPTYDGREPRSGRGILAGRPILTWSLVAAFALMLIGLLAGWIYVQSLYRGMPSLPTTEQLWAKGREQAIEFVDRDGDTIAIRGPRYGRAVRVEELPPHVAQAFIAAEDKRFYEHDGADTQAIIRAAWANFTSGETVSGASTITQQLIKNLVLTPEQTLRRKAQEVRLARELEERLSKDEILELYLNRIYFGAGFYGLGAASRFYFGKAPEELTVGEASLLATLPQAPSRLALTNNMTDAKQRQSYVLREMVAAGFLTESQAARAATEEVELAEPPARDPQFGYALDAATERVNEILPSLPGDLVVTLTIDADLQARINDAFDKRMEEEGPGQNAGQAAGILMDEKGRILAMYGGVDYTENQFNRAMQARRQPGSAFKPFVYAAAIRQGLTPYDVRRDQPTTIDGWSPQNYSRNYAGPMTLTEALQDSVNTIAAQLGQEVGEENIISLIKALGVSGEFQPFPSIALGSQGMNLRDLVRAYGAFMSGGTRVDPYLIERISNSRGDVLYERPAYDPQRVMNQRDAETMVAMMERVITDGTGKRAQLEGWQVAGKTGTSQDWRDAWFVGFSAARLGGVWVGNDDDTPMTRVTGGGLPATLWHDMMVIAHEELEPQPLAGAGSLVTLSPQTRRRIAFYRDVGAAFSATQ